MARGMGRIFHRGGVLWVSYYHHGKEHRESTKSSKRSDAVALLKRRQQEAGSGRPAHEAQKVLLSDLRSLIEADYQLNERRSSRRMGQAWAHVAKHLGDRVPAVSITAARLADYVLARRAEGARNNTVRNELGVLKRAFSLARQKGALLANECPSEWPKVRPGAPRQGFFERGEHDAVKAKLPPAEADVAEFLYWTGWRRTEVTRLRWSNVDTTAEVIRIETTKTNEPRTLPYGALQELRDLIQKRRKITDAVQQARAIIVPWVFHRNGEPVVTFYRSWAAACVKAGFGHEVREPDVLNADGTVKRRGRLVRRVIARIPHDYRRSAARNLSRAGVPERVIMQLCGWKSRSVFDRYRVVPEADLAAGLARLTGTTTAEPAKVQKISG